MRLVFASNNAHKLDEVRAIMPAGVEVVSLHDIGFEQEIEENGTTLAENSRIKAETVWEWINSQQGQTCISSQQSAVSCQTDGVFADDTGLEIDALDGRPGVYTARWAGDPAANRAKALQELKGKSDRGAQFKTVITLLMPSAGSDLRQVSEIQVEGVVRGRIAEEEYGEGGFGYDPVFIPEGYDKTFGELDPAIKNTISHRARAMAKLVKEIENR